MKLFDKIAIVGVGLIGGSIALAIKKKKLASEVIGVSRHKKTLLLAKKIKAIDRGSQDIKIIKDADLVILATPVSVIMNLAPKIAKIIRLDCLVTDVGSTKSKIVQKLEKIFPRYIGSHPLAGSEKRGIVCAHPEIFKNSLCILTPTNKTNKKAILKLRIFWQQLGARIVILSADTHDKILSFISHLPHVIAFSLMETTPKKYLRFAASGLKDTTRLAGADSGLWVDIISSNSKNLMRTIGAFQRNLSAIKTAISQRDKRHLTLILKKAKAKRDTLDCE